MLKNIIINLLGTYEPIVSDYTYQQGSSTYMSHNIEQFIDYPWIFSAIIFSLVIFCVFRFLGGLFKRG